MAVLIATAVGCAGGGASGEKDRANESAARGAPEAGDNFTEQWLAMEQARSGRITWPPEADADAAPSAASSPFWTVLLGTYSGENHLQAASAMLGNVRRIAPELAGATVHTSEKGSMVIYGRFERPDDAAAQDELKRVRAITYSDRPLFPRAILSRVTPRTPGRLRPHDLRTTRLRYPNVEPLYTLQVAVWSDFESGRMSTDEIRRRAEADAGRLRGEGIEAYFHHDDGMKMSIVTVGLYGRDAVDSATGLLSPDVELMMRRFPEHLVNGEPLEVYVDRFNPKRGTFPQRPQLVLVPK